MRRFVSMKSSAVVACGALALSALGAGSAEAAAPRGWKTKNTIGCVAGSGTYQRSGSKVTITSAKVTDRCKGKWYAMISFRTTKHTYSGVYSPNTTRYGHNRTVKWPYKLTLKNASHLYVAECLVLKGTVKTKGCGDNKYKKIY